MSEPKIEFVRGVPYVVEHENGGERELVKVTPVVDGVAKKPLAFESSVNDETIAAEIGRRNRRKLLFDL